MLILTKILVGEARNKIMSNKPKVIIVGAGAAGIAAAARLLEQGLEDVTILEGKDRIGGRIHTVEFGE